MRRQRTLLVTAGLVLAGFVVLVVALLVTLRLWRDAAVAREAAVARIEAMGGSVKIERITEGLNPIPHSACWVDLQDTILDDQQVDEFIGALDQINLDDLRVSMGRTATTETQMARLMGPASHLGHRTVPNPEAELEWMGVTDVTELPSSRQRLPMVVFFENASNQSVKFFAVHKDNLEFRATLSPGRTLQAVTLLEHNWLITDENDKPLGYFVLSDQVEGVPRAIIPHVSQSD